MVLPGCVAPCSGPITCTMPRWSLLQAEQFDAELGAVLFELVDLLGRRLDGDRRAAEHLLGARGRGVIHRGEREIGATYLEAALAQHGEGLRRRHLMDEVQVDEQYGGRFRGLGSNQMLLPDLFEHRLRLSHVRVDFGSVFRWRRRRVWRSCPPGRASPTCPASCRRTGRRTPPGVLQ